MSLILKAFRAGGHFRWGQAGEITIRQPHVSVVPYFPMLKEENVRTQFKELLKHLARHLHPLKIFLYTTGARVGMATQITGDMVSTDFRMLHIPVEICKNREPLTLALTSELVALLRKHFRKSGAPVFDATNLCGGNGSVRRRRPRCRSFSSMICSARESGTCGRAEWPRRSSCRSGAGKRRTCSAATPSSPKTTSARP
jgi:integrase